jgi:hypothetical protein
LQTERGGHAAPRRVRRQTRPDPLGHLATARLRGFAIAEREADEASRHQALRESLRERIDSVTPLPELEDGASELEELTVLAERLAPA